MSYASVAAQNVSGAQPQPDPALLNTGSESDVASVADDTLKVNIVPSDFKNHPATVTSQYGETISTPPPPPPPFSHETPKYKAAKKQLANAEVESVKLWDKLKDIILRPSFAGGLLGVVNVGLFAGASYVLYTEPHLRRDRRTLSATLACTLALIGMESYAADTYLQTPGGQEAQRKAKKEGSLVYRQAREHILRPGVLGGLVGIVNVGILSTVGYLAYDNRHRPHWDRNVLSSITAGLLALWGGEWYLASRQDVRRQFQKS